MLGKWYAFVVYLQRFQIARSEKPDGLFNITNQSKLTHMAKTFISLLSDFGFKRIFGTERNKQNLINFLSAVVHHKIVDIDYLPTEQYGNQERNKRVVYDILCIDDLGEHFIVELQNAPQKFFVERTLFYASGLIQRQLRRGAEKYELKKIYVVSIMNFLLPVFRNNADYIHHIALYDAGEQRVFSDKMEFVYVELPKFTKSVEELETDIDKYLFLMKNLHQLNVVPPVFEDAKFVSLIKESRISTLSKMELEEYIETTGVEVDWKNAIAYAMESGMEKGMEKGMRKGIRQGCESVARKMLRGHYPIDEISELTGLSVAAIRKLQE